MLFNVGALLCAERGKKEWTKRRGNLMARPYLANLATYENIWQKKSPVSSEQQHHRL